MSGNKQRPSLLWDSSVFIALFNKEQDKDLERLRAAIEEVDTKRVILCVSSITRVEVLDTVKAPSAREQFNSFCKHSNVQELLPDQRIIDLSTEVRQAALDAHKADNCRGKLKTPDTIIAATAIVYKIPRLFSYDPDLLNYSKTEVLRNLLVEKPTTLTRPYMKPLIGLEELDER